MFSRVEWARPIWFHGVWHRRIRHGSVLEKIWRIFNRPTSRLQKTNTFYIFDPKMVFAVGNIHPWNEFRVSLHHGCGFLSISLPISLSLFILPSLSFLLFRKFSLRVWTIGVAKVIGFRWQFKLQLCSPLAAAVSQQHFEVIYFHRFLFAVADIVWFLWASDKRSENKPLNRQINNLLYVWRVQNQKTIKRAT